MLSKDYGHVDAAKEILDHFFDGKESKIIVEYLEANAHGNVRAFRSDEIDIDKFKQLITSHHEKAEVSKDRYLQCLIKADQWSAGERVGEEKSNPSSMVSLLSVLYDNNEAKYYDIPILTKEKIDFIFPKNNSSELKQDISNRCEEFLTDLGHIVKHITEKKLNFETALSYFDILFYKHFWAWPSSRTQEEKRDISLYDHLKLSTAIAVCNYLSEEENIDNVKFRIIQGDFSGIQNYIYDIKNTKAAKRLRARSLNVQVYTEFIADKIIKELGLSRFNKIMNAGGKFRILIPDNLTQKFLEVKQNIQEKVFKNFNKELIINLSISHSCSGNDLGADGYSKVLARIDETFLAEKISQNKIILQSNQEWHQNTFVGKNDEKVDECPLCGRPDTLIKYDDENVCNVCKNDSEKGKNVISANYILVTKGSIDYDLVKSISEKDTSKEQKKDLSNIEKIIAINPEIFKDFTEVLIIDVPIEIKFIANYIPEMDFEGIAKQSTGAQMLGILKADVDNLSEIFTKGFKSNNGNFVSISRQATVSRLLDLFFSGYLETFVRENFKDCYFVYAGGDDLVIVGPWDKIIILAKEINEKFKEFVGGNPSIHLSAGISFAKHNYPIKNAIELAEEQLKNAKEKGKNCISLWDHVIKWDDFDKVFANMEKVSEWVKNSNKKDDDNTLKGESMSYSFARNLLEFGRMIKGNEKSKLRWKPLLAYQMARNIKRNSDIWDWLEPLLKEGGEETEETKLKKEYLELIAMYALYKNRKE